MSLSFVRICKEISLKVFTIIPPRANSPFSLLYLNCRNSSKQDKFLSFYINKRSFLSIVQKCSPYSVLNIAVVLKIILVKGCSILFTICSNEFLVKAVTFIPLFTGSKIPNSNCGKFPTDGSFTL